VGLEKMMDLPDSLDLSDNVKNKKLIEDAWILCIKYKRDNWHPKSHIYHKFNDGTIKIFYPNHGSITLSLDKKEIIDIQDFNGSDFSSYFPELREKIRYNA
jgi:hypothetical protein